MTAATETTYPYPCPAWCDCPMDERFAPFHFFGEWNDGTTSREHVKSCGDSDIVQHDQLVDGVVVPGVPTIRPWVNGECVGDLDGAAARAIAANLLAAAGLLDVILAGS